MTGLAAYQEFLDRIRIPMRLACKTGSGWPMVLSLWFIYLDGALYCATRNGARVVSYLTGNSKCAFEIAADQPPYCGIRGQAVASIEKQRGCEVLDLLLERYLGGRENNLAQQLIKNSADEVAIRLDPVSIFSWVFSKRMKDTVPHMDRLTIKICP